ERVGQPNEEPSSLTRGGFDTHRAAELLDLVVDDIHADTASGRLRELARRTETGPQKQLDRLFVRHLIRVTHQTLLTRFAADRVEIQPRAVVTDLDQDFRAFPAQFELDLPRCLLARFEPLLRLLEAVHHGIAE